MIFFVGNDGAIINSTPSPVYQGSANANDIFLVAPFAENLTVTVAFKLPNGVIREPRAMTNKGFIESVINGQTKNQYAMWQFSLPNNITQYYGTVTAQFTFYGANGQMLNSSSTSFVVGKGVPVILPDTPTDTVYQDILKNIAQLQTEIANGYAGFADTMQVETNTLPSNIKASVTVTPVQGTPNTAKQFKFVFYIPEGERGEPGENGEDGEDGNPVYYYNYDIEEVGNENESGLRLFEPQVPRPKIGSICISRDGFLCQVNGIEDGGFNVKALRDLNGNKIGVPVPSGLLFLDYNENELLKPGDAWEDVWGNDFLPPITQEQADVILNTPIYAITSNMQLVKCVQQLDGEDNTNDWRVTLIRNLNFAGGKILGHTTINGNLHVAAGNKLYTDTISGEPIKNGGTGEVTITSPLTTKNIDMSNTNLSNVGDISCRDVNVGRNVYFTSPTGDEKYGHLHGLKTIKEPRGTVEGVDGAGYPYKYANVLKVQGDMFFASGNYSSSDITKPNVNTPISCGIYFTDGHVYVRAEADTLSTYRVTASFVYSANASISYIYGVKSINGEPYNP